MEAESASMNSIAAFPRFWWAREAVSMSRSGKMERLEPFSADMTTHISDAEADPVF